MTSCKLRIATSNDSYTIDVVASQVHEATGLQVRPVLQEIDRRELIVELALHPHGPASRRDVTHCLRRTSPHLEVLASWQEFEPHGGFGPPQPHELCFQGDSAAPAIAHRAFADRVPTAGWQPKAGSESSHWLLAVPAVAPDGRMVAALARRSGHYHRFFAKDAAALFSTIAA